MKIAKNTFLIILLLLFPVIITAQLKRSQDFKSKYKLKEIVILSRHNIRSPLSTNGSALSRLTPNKWINWSSAPSELTLRGGVLETMMGQFFRKWLVEEGLFKENYFPTTDEVNFYANSMQRTIATAQYFSSGFMPLANIKINHRFSPSKMDPVFFPRLTKVNELFKKQAMNEISAMGGKKGIVGINENLKDSYKVIAKVLDLKESPACKNGDTCTFSDYNTKISLVINQEPKMKGSLKLANSASDAFILQYYEEKNPTRAAFGHDISIMEWQKIARIKDVYGDVLFTAPIVAVNVAHPLLVYINDELNASERKFTFLCGHDSNVASVSAALGIKSYELPHSIEKKTPIGCKMVFVKWEDKSGTQYVAVNLVYQSTEQLRGLQMLTLDNPPMVYSLTINGLKANQDGLYSFDEVEKRFKEAIHAYDKIE